MAFKLYSKFVSGQLILRRRHLQYRKTTQDLASTRTFRPRFLFTYPCDAVQVVSVFTKKELEHIFPNTTSQILRNATLQYVFSRTDFRLASETQAPRPYHLINSPSLTEILTYSANRNILQHIYAYFFEQGSHQHDLTQTCPVSLPPTERMLQVTKLKING